MRKSKHVKQATICIAMLLCINITAFTQTAQQYYNNGLTLSANKQYSDAIDNFSRAIKLQSNDDKIFYARALAYQQLAQYDLALADVTDAININPRIAAYFQLRGNCFYYIKNYDNALKDYFKTVALEPDNAMHYFNRGNVYQVKGQYDAALKDYNQAIAINPKYTYAYQMRGNTYLKMRSQDLALADYNQALALEPNNAINHYNIGNLLAAIPGRGDEAIEYYNKSIRLNPRYANAYLGRGILEHNRKMFAPALEDFTKCISLDPNFLNAYNSRGILYISTGEYNLAIADFEKAISLDNNREHPFVVLNIIEPLARLHRFDDAAQYYNMYRESNTNGYIDSPGWLFFKKYMEAIAQNLVRNDFPNALKCLQDAEQLYGTKDKTAPGTDLQQRNYSSILALKGFVLEQMNNTDDAQQAYEQSLLINPNQPDVRNALGGLTKKEQALVQSDKTDPVIKILEPANNTRSISVEDDKVASTTQRIRGQAIDPSGIKTVKLNNKSLSVGENGYFDTTVTVAPGKNTFVIMAIDNNANATSTNVEVNAGKLNTGATVPDKPAVSNNAEINYNPVYYAILIAEQNYQDANINELTGPVNDMNRIYRVLTSKYNFNAENTDTLVNATRASILETIIRRANAMGENDNLFVFYAGHGEMITNPDKSEEGFLVPKDATAGMVSSYISSEDLLRTIKYSKAKHILFVVDACFSGTLFRDLPKDAPALVADSYKDKSRRYLASGNRKPVPDQSVFIEDFVVSLQENRQQYITAEQLIDIFKNDYRKTGLQLQYNPIKNTDDQGGQFVFKRKQ